MKHVVLLASLLLAFCCSAAAQMSAPQPSPPEWAQGKIGNAKLTIKYCSPSVRGRRIFGAGGRVMADPTAPFWRAGANEATSFHTNVNLQVAGLTVPKGNYTLYVNVQDPDAWELVINKQTGQWGTRYDPSQDLGRVKMDMTKPPALVERLKYTIAAEGPEKGTIQLAWEKHIATVAVAVK